MTIYTVQGRPTDNDQVDILSDNMLSSALTHQRAKVNVWGLAF